jgi:hypothetical protein
MQDYARINIEKIHLSSCVIFITTLTHVCGLNNNNNNNSTPQIFTKKMSTVKR